MFLCFCHVWIVLDCYHYVVIFQFDMETEQYLGKLDVASLDIENITFAG